MNRFARIFAIWFLAVVAFWGFANLPRDSGALKSFLEWAGFPWTFAQWVDGQLNWFSTTVLMLDLLVGLSTASAVALACAYSRCGWPMASQHTPIDYDLSRYRT